MIGRKGNTFRTPEAREELLTGLLALLARRPELRDVGIAGYLAGAAVDGAPGMPKTAAVREPGLVVGVSEGVLVNGVRVWAA